MGARVSRADFEWVYTDEPHTSRRKIILEKYPQVKQLYGHDPNFKWVVTGMVVLQLLTLPLIQQLSWPVLVLVAYCFGGVINHSLMLALHEIGHNLAFGHARPNRWRMNGEPLVRNVREPTDRPARLYQLQEVPLGTSQKFVPTVLCQDPVQYKINEIFNFLFAERRCRLTESVVPMKETKNTTYLFALSVLFSQPGVIDGGSSVIISRVHRILYLAVSTKDPDLPTALEAKLFNTTFGKFVWLLFLPFIYIIKPLVVHPKPPEPLELVNLIIQLFFNACVVQLFGWKALWYLIIGSLLSMGLHPVAGHFITEHYMFKKGFETYSYYGALNYIMFNVGYHMEHHDFPAIPASRLPELKSIAGEFYDDLPQHTSFVSALYEFVTDPDIGPYARTMRKERGLDS